MTYGEKKRARRIADKNGADQTDHQSVAGGLSDELKRKLWALAAQIENQLVAIETAFQSKDWSSKDRAVVRALTLVRYGVKLFHGRKYRIQLAFRAARAFHALTPKQMHRHLERFESETARCLEGIEIIPDPLIATLHKVHQRTIDFEASRQPEPVAEALDKPVEKAGDRRAPSKGRPKKPTSAKKRAEQGGHALKAALLSTGVQKTVARSATAVA